MLKPIILHSINKPLETDVYIFNASNDSALACNSLSYTPSKFVKIFERDLATLPMLFAKKTDVVLVFEQPNVDFINQMQALGFELPDFVTKKNFFDHQKSLEYNLQAIRPWGWSKTVHTAFRSVRNQFSFTNVCSVWNEELRLISGRQTAALVLSDILQHNNPLFVKESAIPQIITSLETIPQLFEGNEQWVLKSPWSSSGRGLLRVSAQQYDFTEKVWVKRIIDEQGFIMAEPWHKKVFDFSLLFSVSPDAISLLCLSTFKTGAKGQFLGSYVHWPEDSILSQMGLSNVELNKLIKIIVDSLIKHKFNCFYEGWMGIDAMVIRQSDRLLIQPCVEINCRYTIGHLAFALRKYFQLSSKALLRIGSLKEFNQSNATMRYAKPITPITDETSFVGWIEE